MAANKRKQEEKHLKMLRDLVALPHNKQCFDCDQRGPTYVNMTIGSFVCTSCSGLLRGLNPPHRVKSISMMSFTPDEMECLQCRGNAMCRKVWLGLHDPNWQPLADSKDEFKVKDFMALKYEKKRWYVAPTDAMFEEAKLQNVIPVKKAEPSRPLRTLGGHIPNLMTQAPHQLKAAVPAVKQPVAPPAAQPVAQAAKPASWDLLGEIGGDTMVRKPPAQTTNGSSEPGFADFSAFSSQPMPAAVPTQPAAPVFPTNSTAGLSAPLAAGGAQLDSAAVPPSALGAVSAPAPAAAADASDRYAALADLDSVFGSGPNVSWGDTGGGMDRWSANGAPQAAPHPVAGQTAPGGGAAAGPPAQQAPGGFGGAVGNPFGGVSVGVGVFPPQSVAPSVAPAAAPLPNPFLGAGGAPQAYYGQPVTGAPGMPPQYAPAPPHMAGYAPQQWGGQMAAYGAPAPVAYGAPGQYAKAGQQPGMPAMMAQQQQQYGAAAQSWPAAGNPFLSASGAVQQPMPPRGSSTNPFL